MSAIDYEMTQFFGHIANLRMEVQDYVRYSTCPGRNSIWTCKNGTKVLLKNMTDSHLKNTLALVKRKDPKNIWVSYLTWELRYREHYPKVLEELEHAEHIADMCF